jgi:hypothetical protein
MSGNNFYDSHIVQQELIDMQSLYKDLYDISMRFPMMDRDEQREHLDKTMALVAKQKVFYARIALLALEDPEASDVKVRIDQITHLYSGGKTINQVLDDMEKKLKSWRKQIDAQVDQD